MRLLIVTRRFNSLTQRLFVELREDGHEVSVEYGLSDDLIREAVDLFDPEIVIASDMKRPLPDDVVQRVRCMIVYAGIIGERGPSALDWAVLNGERTWGVSILDAAGEADPETSLVWATRNFPMRRATKSSLYRGEVTEGAVQGVRDAITRLQAGQLQATRVAPGMVGVRGRQRPAMTQEDRRIDWSRDRTAQVLAKVRASDSGPGVEDEILGLPVSLFNAREAMSLTGTPGEVIGTGGKSVAIATVDGAVWIGHLVDRSGAKPALKLPAVWVLGPDRLAGLEDVGAGPLEIWTERHDGVCYLHFPFHNGAMSTERCHRLRAAFLAAAEGDDPVIALMGGPEFWSNGLHLTAIEAADNPAQECWANIMAMNALASAIQQCRDRWVVSALQGNAGATGVFLALSADVVWARSGMVLNPHHRGLSHVYGVEGWVHALARRVGEDRARQIVASGLPMGAAEAVRLGVLDDAFGADGAAFRAEARQRLKALAAAPETLETLLAEKAGRLDQRQGDELSEAAARETQERMQAAILEGNTAYHEARSRFVRKSPLERTPPELAVHRRAG